MTKIEDLIAAQTEAQEQIAYRLASFVKLAKPRRTIAAIDLRLDDVTKLWEECRTRQQEIVKLADESFRRTHKYFLDQVFRTITDSMDETRDALMEHRSGLLPTPKDSASDSKTPPTAQGTKGSTTTLPAIPLPKFSGEITAWPGFRENFETLVGTRTDLTDMQRLHYLRASLHGEAARLISNTPSSGEYYKSAWTSLSRRYERKRAIIYAHLDKLIELPRLTSGSVSELKALLDLSYEIHVGLSNTLKLTELDGHLFVFLLVNKLDRNSRRDWELKLADVNTLPSYHTLAEFLDLRAGALEPIAKSVSETARDRFARPKLGITRSHGGATPANNTATKATSRQENVVACACCGEAHRTYKCTTFLALAVSQRISLMQRNKRCLNCLADSHQTKQCSSKYRCRHCQQMHHTLLHLAPRSHSEVESKPEDSNQPELAPTSAWYPGESENTTISASNCCSHTGAFHTLLPTASVLVRSRAGRIVKTRALLDQGSQSTFISQALVNALKPALKPAAVRVKGIGAAAAGPARGLASFHILTGKGEADVAVNALVLPQLTSYLPPPVPVSTSFDHLRNLTLADPEPFSHSKIELIIGTDHYFDFIREGLIRGSTDSPSAQKTTLGWVLAGRLADSPSGQASTNSCQITVQDADSLSQLIQGF